MTQVTQLRAEHDALVRELNLLKERIADIRELLLALGEQP